MHMHHPLKCTSIRLRLLSTKRLMHSIACDTTNEIKPIASDAKKQRTIASLDLLLGSSSDEDIRSDEAIEPRIAWWERPISARQTRPARRTRQEGTSNAEEGRGEGRFMANEELFGGIQRSGQATRLNEPIILPTSPFSLGSYTIALVLLASFGTLINVNSLQGHTASADFASSLTLVNVQPSDKPLAELVLRSFGSLAIPLSPVVFLHSEVCLLSFIRDVELLMGTAPFLFLYTASGLFSQCLLLFALSHNPDMDIDASSSSSLFFLGPVGSISACLAASIQIKSGPIASAIKDHASITSDTSVTSSLQREQRRLTPLIIYAYTALLLSPIINTPFRILNSDHMLDDVLHLMSPVLLQALVGAISGWIISSSIGPRYQVSREPDIPDGAMTVQTDQDDDKGSKDLIVVVDTRSGLGLVTACVSYGVVLLVAFQTMAS
jgi:hypothetical protein